MKSIILLAAILLLAGCASTPKPVTPPETAVATTPAPAELGTQATILAHLDNATAIATAGNDAAGVQCWTAAKAWVATLPLTQPTAPSSVKLPEPTGPSGVAEIARIKAKQVQSDIAAGRSRIDTLRSIVQNGFPDSLVTACAVVTYDARMLRDKILLLMGLGMLAP